MAKKFNITGNCRAEKHYMADVSKKLDRVYDMVESGDYFIINRPRQYGKTTMLISIAKTLSKSPEWLVFNISFEGMDSATFDVPKNFYQAIVKLLADEMFNQGNSEIETYLRNKAGEISIMSDLSTLITGLAQKTNKKLVLLVDEVDKSSNNQLFLDFLSMLRTKYLRRDMPSDATFHAVILAGVHDVKTLKLKISPDAEQKYNSPWNIATEFKIDMNLQVSEIKPMLEEYAADKSLKIDTQAIAEKLFYFTSGYPFLVSKLCKMFDEEWLPEKMAHPELIGNEKTWAVEDVDTIVAAVVKENNTNFETLIKNLETYPDLYDLVHNILLENQYEVYSIHDPAISLGILYGILKNGSGVKVHNRIYEAIIYDYMASKTKSKMVSAPYGHSKDYRLTDNQLNMELVLLKFQAFMKEQYSQKDQDFVERNGRLIFLAFIKPIINGSGYDFKEPQISEERRLDVIVTYFNHKYVVELKIWYGEKAHEEGLLQLTDYLDRMALNEGYLLIFNKNKKKSWKNGWITAHGKRIFLVWV